jgi:hypothetical protein
MRPGWGGTKDGAPHLMYHLVIASDGRVYQTADMAKCSGTARIRTAIARPGAALSTRRGPAAEPEPVDQRDPGQRGATRALPDPAQSGARPPRMEACDRVPGRDPDAAPGRVSQPPRSEHRGHTHTGGPQALPAHRQRKATYGKGPASSYPRRHAQKWHDRLCRCGPSRAIPSVAIRPGSIWPGSSTSRPIWASSLKH